MKKNINLNGIWDFFIDGKKHKINVPANWFLEGFDISGKAIYETKFNLNKKEKGKRYFVIFYGVDYFAEVFVNEKFAGKHEGYFQKFRFDITDLIKNGKNILRVIVDSPKENEDIWPDKKILIKGIFNHHDARPGSWDKKYGQDKNTGGIWNDVLIEIIDLIEIERVKITPFLKDDGIWNVNCELIINNYTKKHIQSNLNIDINPFNFKGRAYKSKREVLLSPGSNKIFVCMDLQNPNLWWTWDIGKPDLYEFVFEIKADKIKDIFKSISGIREFKKGIDKYWYLNGKRIFLRGSNIIATQWLCEYKDTLIKKDVKLMKEMNINIIRIHAHVNREELYAELDKNGIMVWQDFALQWSYDTSEKFMENAISQIKDMVNQFYNHPSIVIWCCHNEPSVNEKQLDPVLVIKVKEEDAVRHIEKSSDFGQHYYPGWYVSNTPQNFYMDMINAQKAFVISEYGAQALPCLSTMKKMMPKDILYNFEFDKWQYYDFQPEFTFNIAGIRKDNSLEEFIKNSQDYQANLLKTLTETFRINRYTLCNGILQFMFVECWPSITWAVVDYFRNPKKGYFYLKTAMQPILPGYRIFREKISKGESLFWGSIWDSFFIINDTKNVLKGFTVKFIIKDSNEKVFLEDKKLLPEIPADSILFPFSGKFKNMQFLIPDDINEGNAKIELTLYNNKNTKIAENFYTIEITEKIYKKL